MIFLRRREHIDRGFSRALAGQVTAGLMPNAEPEDAAGGESWAREMEESAMRARAALTVIGLMLANATDDQPTHDVLNLLVADLEARHGS